MVIVPVLSCGDQYESMGYWANYYKSRGFCVTRVRAVSKISARNQTSSQQVFGKTRVVPCHRCTIGVKSVWYGP